MFKDAYVEAHFKQKIKASKLQAGSSWFENDDTKAQEDDAIERAAPLKRERLTFDQWLGGSPQQRFPNTSYNNGANGVRTTKSTWASTGSARASHILSRRGRVILKGKEKSR